MKPAPPVTTILTAPTLPATLTPRADAHRYGAPVGRVYLSPPDVGPVERDALVAAFDGGWIAPVGPDVDAFEREVAAVAGVGHAAALSSGTAALHLALLLSGVGPGDAVLVPTLTFVASANAVGYLGADPVLVDCDPETWQMDPALVAEALEHGVGTGGARRPPKAVVTVDLYGQCADADPIGAACASAGVTLLEDAAEALGATYKGRPAGSLGTLAVFSFNGNKVITTSGGGMLVGDDAELVARARHLATQAREPAPHYEHVEPGFNYRMSNLLAALGRAQLASLPARVERRRAIKARYREGLGDLPGLSFMPDAEYGRATNWLTVVELDPDRFGADRERVRVALEAADIEARPAWKPLHLQPLFARAEVWGGAVAARIFDRGLCLPSGSSLGRADQDRVIDIIRAQHRTP
jgi:dTDP-4-amino-4,6-dideoxygalactose transaminase